MLGPAGGSRKRGRAAPAEPMAPPVASQSAEIQIIEPIQPPSSKIAQSPVRKPKSARVALPRVVSPAEESAFATVEREIGGRQALVSTLSSAQLPPALEKVLGMIADPGNDGRSLAKICSLADCSLTKLMGMFRSAVMARGQMIAISRIAAKLPDVAASVMEDSIAGWRPCLSCEGTQVITVKDYPPGTKPQDLATTELIDVIKPCPSCMGRGRVYWQPPHDMQKTSLMIGGLLDKGGPRITTIVANQNVQAGTDSTSYDSLIGALDKAIYGEGRGRTGGAAMQESYIDGELEGVRGE